jgi:hypothetical protein
MIFAVKMMPSQVKEGVYEACKTAANGFQSAELYVPRLLWKIFWFRRPETNSPSKIGFDLESLYSMTDSDDERPFHEIIFTPENRRFLQKKPLKRVRFQLNLVERP